MPNYDYKCDKCEHVFEEFLTTEKNRAKNPVPNVVRRMFKK